MSFQDLFPIKFKMLRTTHNLSTAQAAEFFSFKSKGSIASLEFMKAGPTLATLEDVVDFFSISMDWLAGKSSIIYREEILSAIEDKLLTDMVTNNPQLHYYQLSTWWIRGSKRYSQRKQAFSLPVRANIIFCLQALRKSSLIFAEQGTYPETDASYLDGIEKSAIEKMIEKLHNTIYPLLVSREGKRRANIRWKLCSTCYDLLQDYLRSANPRTTPAYDVEEAWNNLQKDKE